MRMRPITVPTGATGFLDAYACDPGEQVIGGGMALLPAEWLLKVSVPSQGHLLVDGGPVTTWFINVVGPTLSAKFESVAVLACVPVTV